jgi:hypothetical protein
MPVIAQNHLGEFRQIGIDPVSVQPGDLVQQIGNQLVVSRGGHVVATRDLSGESVSVASEIDAHQVIDKAIFFRSYPVAGIQATITGAIRNPNGSVMFSFASGSQREFTSVEQALTQVQYLDAEAATAEDMLILKTLRRSPDGANLENCVGAQVSADFNANEEIVLTIGNA